MSQNKFASSSDIQEQGRMLVMNHVSNVMSENAQSDKMWYIDSGYTNHMAFNLIYLIICMYQDHLVMFKQEMTLVTN